VALHYYASLGFRTYREGDGVIQKVFEVAQPIGSVGRP
jgi:hypothetical protein